MKEETTINVSNAGTVAENVTVEAKQVAGRDLYHIEMQKLEHETRLKFSDIDTSPYSIDNYVPPNFTKGLLSKSMEMRILILSGGQGFNKSSFIRHLAHEIHTSSSHSVKEIQSNVENQSIYRELFQGDEKLIYVLDQLHPQHLDYDLEKFVRAAQQKDLYLLITTDLSIDTWDLSDNAITDYTLIIPTKNLYSSETLTKCLKSIMLKKKELLKNVLPSKLENILNDTLFDKSIDHLAKGFETPENISFFISLLCREKDEISKDRLDEIIEEVNNGNQSLVTKWFRTLDNKQKLIALGVSLLEGMYDDQFFSVMQEITQGFWKHSDSTLLAMDYIDLEFLLDYFKLEALGTEKQVLKNRFPGQRTDIIKAAWSTHRRHILAILPVLVKVVNESVNDKASNWEKYGTRQRQMNIRLAIGTTIGDIGLVSIPSIENALIELASQNNSALQRVAAKSLARWREFDRDDKLFDTLDSWLNNRRIQNLLNDFLAKRENQDKIKIGSNATSYLKATAVLALSYAANYDSPNHLNIDIIRLIKDIAMDKDNMVRTRIQEALPRIIHHHVLQLKDFIIEDLMKFDDLTECIGLGLSKAYKDYPHDLKTTLFQWLTNCSGSSSESNQRKKFTFRDKVLVTVFETFQTIELTGTSKDIITVDEIYAWLLKFNKTDRRKSVRESLYLTLGKMISLNWKKAEKNLSKFFSAENLDEVHFLVKKFSEIYLDQRQNIQGSRYEFKWHERIFPAWLSFSDRPFTEIEKIMLKWMASEDLMLKQISTLSLIDFARVFETDELERIESLKEEEMKEQKLRSPITRNQVTPSIQSKRTELYEPAISIWKRIYIFFLLLFEPRNSKITLKSILKLLYRYPNFSRQHLHIVFSKWVRSPDKTTQKLANWLKRLIR